MTEKPPQMKKYPIGSRTGAVPPSYGRVVERLSINELREEIEQARGTEEYRDACRAELARRGV